jgi:hypothetical protein
MSGASTDLAFKWVQERSYTSTDHLLLWLWERYAANRDNGDEAQAEETRNIIEAVMGGKP